MLLCLAVCPFFSVLLDHQRNVTQTVMQTPPPDVCKGLRSALLLSLKILTLPPSHSTDIYGNTVHKQATILTCWGEGSQQNRERLCLYGADILLGRRDKETLTNDKCKYRK